MHAWAQGQRVGEGGELPPSRFSRFMQIPLPFPLLAPAMQATPNYVAGVQILELMP